MLLEDPGIFFHLSLFGCHLDGKPTSLGRWAPENPAPINHHRHAQKNSPTCWLAHLGALGRARARLRVRQQLLGQTVVSPTRLRRSDGTRRCWPGLLPLTFVLAAGLHGAGPSCPFTDREAGAQVGSAGPCMACKHALLACRVFFLNSCQYLAKRYPKVTHTHS
jgi:hypothetical protein